MFLPWGMSLGLWSYSIISGGYTQASRLYNLSHGGCKCLFFAQPAILSQKNRTSIDFFVFLSSQLLCFFCPLLILIHLSNAQSGRLGVQKRIPITDIHTPSKLNRNTAKMRPISDGNPVIYINIQEIKQNRCIINIE